MVFEPNTTELEAVFGSNTTEKFEISLFPKHHLFLLPTKLYLCGQLTLRKGCTLYRHKTRDLEQDCCGVNHKHPSAERWDLEFGSNTTENFSNTTKKFEISRSEGCL